MFASSLLRSHILISEVKIRNVNRSPVVVVLNIARKITKALIDPGKVQESWVVTITLDVYLEGPSSRTISLRIAS